MSADLWDLLHDAGISSINWEGTSALVKVDGGFLREIFPEAGDEFIIRLNDCELFEYTTYVDEIKMTNIPNGWREQPEILSAIETSDGVEVYCAKGTLRLRYASYSLFLDDKTPLTILDLEQAITSQFNKRHARS